MRLNKVFGVSTSNLESYVEREELNTKLQDAFELNRQIVIYGACNTA